MAARGFTWRLTRIAALSLSVALTLLVTVSVDAQTKGTKTQKPVTLPIIGPIANRYPQPVRNALPASAAHAETRVSAAVAGASPTPTPCPAEDLQSKLPAWTLTLSGSYLFANDRSRTGGVSLNSDSAIVDLTADLNKFPWTCLDFSYIYSYASGSSPAGTNETGNQNAG